MFSVSSPNFHFSTDANSNAGLSEALGEQNIQTLQNQVVDLQERLNTLQVPLPTLQNIFAAVLNSRGQIEMLKT